MVTKYETVIISPDAGTVDYHWSPGKGMKGMILYSYIHLDTDATSVTRYLRVMIRDRHDNILRSWFDSLTANQVSDTDIGSTTYSVGIEAGTQATDGHNAVGGNWIIYEDDVFTLEVDAGVAGDVLSGAFKVAIAPIKEDFHI